MRYELSTVKDELVLLFLFVILELLSQIFILG